MTGKIAGNGATIIDAQSIYTTRGRCPTQLHAKKSTARVKTADLWSLRRATIIRHLSVFIAILLLTIRSLDGTEQRHMAPLVESIRII